MSHSFLSQQNLQLLWDVIYELKEFQALNQDLRKHISEIFSSKIQLFCNQNAHLSLLELNKLYILQLLKYIPQIQEKYNGYNNNNNKNNKLIIPLDNAIIHEPITYEELSNQKQKQFEQTLSHYEKDFQEMMHAKAPPMPNFADDVSLNANPIDFETSIQHMTEQRNYDEQSFLNANKGTIAKTVQWGENSMIDEKKENNFVVGKNLEKKLEDIHPTVVHFLQKLKHIE